MSGLRDKIKFLEKLPPFLGFLLGKLNFSANLLYGKAYKAHKELMASGNYDASSLLENSVLNAIKNVPYYQSRYKDLAISGDFLQQIKPVDKELIMSDIDQFLAVNKGNYNYDIGTTGGTSGKPLALYALKNRYAIELATMHSIWGRIGYNHHFRAVIRNHRLDKDFIVNPITKEFLFDGFKLSDAYFEKIYSTIKRYRIKFVHCYPSTAYEFGNYLVKNNKDVSWMKGFFCGSENIFDHQRIVIEQDLGLRMMTWFGHSEKLILMGECATSSNYHVEPSYGYVELLDENDQVITQPGVLGELVGTSFYNPVMPLIRYRTGDFAEIISKKCDACGRETTILSSVKGRWSGEKVYNKDGTFVTTTALNLHSDLYQKIEGLQYLHSENGKLTVLVIKGTTYTSNDEAALLAHFRGKLNPDAEVDIQYVQQLKKQKNGKFLLLIKEL